MSGYRPESLQTPGVDPVGLTHYPEGWQGQPRIYSRATRWLAYVLLAVFVAATLSSSALSLGAYCLTTDAGDTRTLRDNPMVQRVSDP